MIASNLPRSATFIISQRRRLYPQVVLTTTTSRFISSTSTSLSSQQPPPPPPSAPVKRRRQRHSFKNLDNIPSFQDFQQQVQLRSLFRHYLRMIAPLASDHRKELLEQIRKEFRMPQESNWHVKRSLSDGSRRLKELGTMLGATAHTRTAVDNVSQTVINKGIDDTEPDRSNTNKNTERSNESKTTTVPDNPWPWQR